MSETAVVVLPSPAGVGVIAVTRDELAVGRVGEAVEDGEGDLGLVAAVRLELVLLDARGLGDFGDRPQLGVLRDLETRKQLTHASSLARTA